MNRINTEQAAKILNMHPEMIRAGMRNKELPIGLTVERKRTNYIIYEELCKKYIEAL